MKRFTRITSCVLLLSLVLVGLGETENMVLCIGYDGHIAFEDTRIGVCNHTLEQAARDRGLSPTDAAVRNSAECCPCSDVDLPGRSLDYPELSDQDVVYISEPADIPAVLLAPACTGFAHVPCGDVIPRSPPPFLGDTVAQVSLASVIILA